MRRLSSTVRSTIVPRPCGTCAMPAAAICSGRRPMIECPAKFAAPVPSIIPEMARSVVVLPAPFAPRMTTTSPTSTEKSIPCSTRTAP